MVMMLFPYSYTEYWYCTPKGMAKRDGTVRARLRIGHLYLTQVLSPKRITPALLCQLQRSTDNKPLTDKLC